MTKSANLNGLTEASMTWLVLGLVGPLMPAGVVALMAILRKASLMYGPLFGLVGVAVLFCILLLRPAVTEDRRKSLKLGLDAAWNLWAFIGVGLVFVSVGTIGGDMAKLESQLKLLSPGWLSFAFITVCSTAAARFSVAVADWITSRRPKQTGAYGTPMPNLVAALADLKDTGQHRFNEMQPSAQAFRREVIAAMRCQDVDIELRQVPPNWDYLLIDHRDPNSPVIGEN